MSKHHKKINAFQQQKIMTAQHKKEFCRWMKHIFNTVAGKDIYKLIPAIILDYAYENRLRFFKVIAAEGYNVPDDILKETKTAISPLTKGRLIEIKPSGLKFSFEEFFTYCLSATRLKTIIAQTEIAEKEIIIDALKDFDTKSLFDDDVNRWLIWLLFTLGMVLSETGKHYYWMEANIGKGIAINNNLIRVHCQEPVTRQIEINGNSRPVFRVGWAYASFGMKWAEIKPSVLNIKNPFPEIPVEVYIQSHALQRLAERMDKIPISLVHYGVYMSFKEPKICYDKNNNVLIECYIDWIKAGYFVVELIEGILVIKTFLFITNTGTPEAQLLEANTGLQKTDKQYFAFDKLSTFMNADIDNMPELQKILIDSGCQSLIELSNHFKVFIKNPTGAAPIEHMLNYLKQSNDENPERWLDDPDN